MVQEWSILMKTMINNDTQLTIDENIFDRVNKVVKENEKISDEKVINLMLTDSEQIQALNKKFRGNDKRTDVLSFPSELDFIPDLGDIIIDVEIANMQKGDRTLQQELQFLYLHGLLHLLGYDHLAKKEKEIMKSKEIKYWKLINGGFK